MSAPQMKTVDTFGTPPMSVIVREHRTTWIRVGECRRTPWQSAKRAGVARELAGGVAGQLLDHRRDGSRALGSAFAVVRGLVMSSGSMRMSSK
jgi:hypothetical protein